MRLYGRVKGVMADQEESLLQQLTEITRVMQEGQLVEGATPERAGNQKEWEGRCIYTRARRCRGGVDRDRLWFGKA